MTDISSSHSSNGVSTGLADLFDRATVDRLLMTTRAVRRRLDLDRPVEPEVIEECINIAVQAPAAHNQQNWRWVVVTDEEKRRQIAELCKITWRVYASSAGNQRRRASRQGSSEAPARLMESAQWLADHLHAVPVLVVACQAGRAPSSARSAAVANGWGQAAKNARPEDGPEHTDASADRRIAQATLLREAIFFGSIFPAIWSFQLALRSRGLGTVITANHLPLEDKVGEVLGIPSNVTQIALLPVAYTKGIDFRPARRTPARELTYWNSWGETRLAEDDSTQPADLMRTSG